MGGGTGVPPPPAPLLDALEPPLPVELDPLALAPPIAPPPVLSDDPEAPPPAPDAAPFDAALHAPPTRAATEQARRTLRRVMIRS
jgi:hypothetical protein